MPKDEHEGPTPESQEKQTTVVSIRSVIQANTPKEGYSDPVAIDIRSSDCWDDVYLGIESILDENPQLTFRPEDVYVELVENRAILFMNSLGWMVLSTERDQFTNERTLLIWLAYTYEKGGSNWISHSKWLNDIAVGEQCSFIEGRSAVPQLEPYALKHGWVIDTRIYRKEVDHGR